MSYPTTPSNPLEALAKRYRLDPDLLERIYYALEPYQSSQGRALSLTISVARAIASYIRANPGGGVADAPLNRS